MVAHCQSFVLFTSWFSFLIRTFWCTNFSGFILDMCKELKGWGNNINPSVRNLQELLMALMEPSCPVKTQAMPRQDCNSVVFNLWGARGGNLHLQEKNQVDFPLGVLAPRQGSTPFCSTPFCRSQGCLAKPFFYYLSYSCDTIWEHFQHQLRSSCSVVVECVKHWSWQLGFRSLLLYLLVSWLQVCNFTSDSASHLWNEDNNSTYQECPGSPMLRTLRVWAQSLVGELNSHRTMWYN